MCITIYPYHRESQITLFAYSCKGIQWRKTGNIVIYPRSPKDHELNQKSRREQGPCTFSVFEPKIFRNATIHLKPHYFREGKKNPPKKNPTNHSLTIALHLKSRTGKSTEAEEVPRETVEFARSFELQMQGEILFWKIYSNSIYRAHECQKKSDTFLSLFTFCLLPSFSVSLLHLSFSLFFFSFISCTLSLP